VTIRVLIADDQALVRSGFRLIIEARDDLEVVGEAEDGAEAVRLAAELEPDVILLDIRMPNLDGIEATRAIVASGSRARVLVLTTFDLDEYVYGAIRAGASGFLLKDVRPAGLIDAIRLVAAGNALLGPTVTRRLLARFAEPSPSTEADAEAVLASLTHRERLILRLLSEGLSNAEIAAQLVISETTVKTHVSNLLRKLGVRDRVQAVIFAYQTGIVDPRAPERIRPDGAGAASSHEPSGGEPRPGAAARPKIVRPGGKPNAGETTSLHGAGRPFPPARGADGPGWP
jgi:DNA-binding NarL/FixJ family response regulator